MGKNLIMFITVSKGLNGTYFIILADECGPIERLDCCNFETKEEAEIYAEKLANAHNIRFLN